MRGQTIAAFVLLIVLIVGFVGFFVVFKGITGELSISTASLSQLLAAARKGNADACKALEGRSGLPTSVKSACKPFWGVSATTPTLPAPTINIPTTTPTPTVTPTAPRTPQVNVPTSIKPTLTKAQVWGKPVTSIKTCIKAPCPIGVAVARSGGIRLAIPKKTTTATPVPDIPPPETKTTESISALPKDTNVAVKIEVLGKCQCRLAEGTKITCLSKSGKNDIIDIGVGAYPSQPSDPIVAAPAPGSSSGTQVYPGLGEVAWVVWKVRNDGGNREIKNEVFCKHETYFSPGGCKDQIDCIDKCNDYWDIIDKETDTQSLPNAKVKDCTTEVVSDCRGKDGIEQVTSHEEREAVCEIPKV